MKKPTAIAVCLLAAAGVCWFAQAGNLEPPGPPAPTMVTLQQIYDELDGLAPGVVGVPKTGQTVCYDSTGTVIPCAGTGQDGEHQTGVAVDPRFTDKSDGTVRDNLTGLVWLQNANCFGPRNWTSALSDANTLADGSCDLTDGSAAGDWRLPNVKELQSLIDFGQFNPAVPSGHPFSAVQSDYYWSSTSHTNVPDNAWRVLLNSGYVGYERKIFGNYVWPVRDGE